MSDFRLKAFYSVAKNLSFTRAAKELFVSQPAITKHINELERQYSVRLFDRTGGKIMLTDAGRLMLEHCSRILDEYNRMEYDMNLLNERSSGHISIGASTTVAQYVLPQILAEFTERFPQIEVSLTNGNSRDIENALLNHDIDLGMVEGITHSAGLQYEPFLEDELVAIIKQSGNESMPEEITPQELCRQPLVIREQGSGTLEVIEIELEKHGIRPQELNIRIRLGSTEAIKAFLRHSRCNLHRKHAARSGTRSRSRQRHGPDRQPGHSRHCNYHKDDTRNDACPGARHNELRACRTQEGHSRRT